MAKGEPTSISVGITVWEDEDEPSTWRWHVDVTADHINVFKEGVDSSELRANVIALDEVRPQILRVLK